MVGTALSQKELLCPSSPFPQGSLHLMTGNTGYKVPATLPHGKKPIGLPLLDISSNQLKTLLQFHQNWVLLFPNLAFLSPLHVLLWPNKLTTHNLHLQLLPWEANPRLLMPGLIKKDDSKLNFYCLFKLTNHPAPYCCLVCKFVKIHTYTYYYVNIKDTYIYTLLC